MTSDTASGTVALFASRANSKTIDELAAGGTETILFPVIEAERCFDSRLSEIAKAISDFNWLIFTDVFAVEYFLAGLEENGADLFELDTVHICAYGESVADRLRYARLHADVVTNTVETTDVFTALRDFVGHERDSFTPLSFLVLCDQISRPEIADRLSDIGSKVVELPVYRVRETDQKSTARLRALLKGGAIDEFIFTSPDDVLNLSHLFRTENLADILAETRLAARNAQTKRSLQEFRLMS